MARDFKRNNKLAVISDLNVTPLIDLAFSLLIIFMITTPVIEQYNRIDLPDQPAENIKPPPPIEDKFITIDAEGSYHWGTDPVSATELEARLDAVADDLDQARRPTGIAAHPFRDRVVIVQGKLNRV